MTNEGVLERGIWIRRRGEGSSSQTKECCEAGEGRRSRCRSRIKNERDVDDVVDVDGGRRCLWG